MSIKEGRDYIYLIWKAPEMRRQYIVGQLSRNGQYEFSYGFEVKDAIEKGFKLLISFNDIDKVYKSDILFPVFSSRLPDRKRRGLDKILAKYNMEEYDAYKLLKRGGARLPIDNLEFIDPILDDVNSGIKRIFYLAGPRHYIGCNGDSCDKSVDLKAGERVTLILEPKNNYDKNAIRVCDGNNIHIGYIPRYYSEGIRKLLDKNYQCSCSVYEVLKDNNCNECIKIEMVIN